jgi:hypothetical protein
LDRRGKLYTLYLRAAFRFRGDIFGVYGVSKPRAVIAGRQSDI